MNISIIAAEIARRIPEMAKDSVVNNESVIRRILEGDKHLKESKPPRCICGASAVLIKGEWKCEYQNQDEPFVEEGSLP